MPHSHAALGQRELNGRCGKGEVLGGPDWRKNPAVDDETGETFTQRWIRQALGDGPRPELTAEDERRNAELFAALDAFAAQRG